MVKLKVGFYSFTSCGGCQIIVINSEELFGELSDVIELVRLPLIQADNYNGPCDVAFIEGAITNKTQISKLKKIRENAKHIISFGTCATFGGVNAIRNLKKEFKKSKIYGEFLFLENIDVNSLDNYVKVDYKLRGCPPTKEEFLSVLKSLSAGVPIPDYEKAVCVECRANKNKCLLALKQDCLGPVTCGGCNALCTTKGIICYGCRGPVKKANIDMLVKLFEKRGLTDEEIKERFVLFAGTSKRYSKITKNKNNKNRLEKRKEIKLVNKQ